MPPQSDRREEIIRGLFPLVKKIARRVGRIVKGSDFDDLIGEGSIGLIRAVDSFDAQRGPTLEQYAGHIIAGAMLNGIRRLDPVSERVRRDVREAERERYTLASECGQLPSMREMEERRPGLRRARMHAYRYTPLSLDGPLPSGENFTTNWFSDPGGIVERESRYAEVRAALEKLPPRARRVLAMHYFEDHSLHAIGRKLYGFAATRIAGASSCTRRVAQMFATMNPSGIELEGPAALNAPALQAQPLVGLATDMELEAQPTLPRDHPSWMRDALSVSSRARALIARLRPIIIRVLTFWDHRRPCITVGGRNLGVDPSGSYRFT